MAARTPVKKVASTSPAGRTLRKGAAPAPIKPDRAGLAMERVKKRELELTASIDALLHRLS